MPGKPSDGEGSRTLPGEFGLIERWFAPLARDLPGAFGLRDDAAVLDVPEGRQLVATVDTMVRGVHFLADDPADAVGRKLLRVNLSDLAAMGATPLACLLSVALDDPVDPDWMDGFSAGLAADCREYAVPLAGGDTVRTPGLLTLTLTALGTVPNGAALRRAGARPGDDVWVTGTLGDAALGLLVLGGRLAGLPAGCSDHLAARYRLPQPRLEAGIRLAGLATAAADISDGLLADLGHICAASGVGAALTTPDIPLSGPAREAIDRDPELFDLALAGGDDYELVFTAGADRLPEIGELAGDLDLAMTRIGRIVAGSGVRALDAAGQPVLTKSAGFSHF